MFALSSSKRFVLAAVCAAAMIAAASACAQDDPPPEAGRISYISGNVSIQAVTSDDWGQAYPNLPVGPGDRIFTDSDGRAEIQVGQTYVRIGPNSDVTLVDDSTFNINFGIAQGSIHLHSFGLWPRQLLDISTPNGNAEFGNSGDLRVDVMPTDGATVFTNLGQFADITAAGDFRQELNYGQSLELAGSNPVSPQWLQPAGPDDLDSWSQQRDQQLSRVASFQYVSPDIPGAADLDANGDWQPATEYGAVWFPRNVSPDWEPYHNGHWINRDPWGWVWVEDESWGYAPFHYGRWVNYNSRWGWVPGPVNVRPIWSPALVVFAGGVHFGGGGGLSVWFPLGPGEAYRPWYRCSPRYIDQVNITNIRESSRVHVQNTYVNVNVTSITYVNQTRGMSAMRQDDFASGRSMRNVAVRVDPRDMQQARPLLRPEGTPTPRAIVSRPVTRPVPVSVQRPQLINQQGRQIAARPGATPVAAPVRPAPPMRQLPGRTIVAAPAHPVPNRPEGGQFPGVQNGQQLRPGTPNNGSPGGAPRANPVAPVQGVQRQPLNPQVNPNPPANNSNERQPGSPNNGYPGGPPRANPVAPVQGVQRQPLNPQVNPNPPANNSNERQPGSPNNGYPGGAPRANPVAPVQGVQRPFNPQVNQNPPANNNIERQPGQPPLQPTGQPTAPPNYRQQDRPNQTPGNNDRQQGPQPIAPGVRPTGRPVQPPPISQQDRPNYQQQARPNQPQPQNPPPEERPIPPVQEHRQVMPPQRPVYQPQQKPAPPPPNHEAAPQQQNKPQPKDQKPSKDQKKDDKDKKDDKKHD